MYPAPEPPEGVAQILPLFNVQPVGKVLEKLAVIEVGCVMLKVIGASEQLLASLMFNVYPPAHCPVMLEVVCPPGAQVKDFTPVPPITLAESEQYKPKNR